MKESNLDSPSDLVFDVARSIGDDMHHGINSAICDLEDYSMMLNNMRIALRKVRKNIIKHSVPAAGNDPLERKKIRLRLRAIYNTMAIASKIDSMLTLTMEDIEDVMKPYASDPETELLLLKIMGEQTY